MKRIHITPCNLTDLPQLQQIAIQSYNDHYIYLWHDGGAWYRDRCFSQEALAKELADKNAAFFLIYLQDRLVGFLKLNTGKALEGYAAEDCLELERIYLTKEASGKGIGSAVVNFTVAFARERNMKVVWLKAMDSSLSVSFYEKNGFERCGNFMLDFPQMKEEFRGMYIMKREL